MRVASQCELAKTIASLRVGEFESGSKPSLTDTVCQGFTCSIVPSVVLLVLLLLDPVLLHKTNHIKIKFRILAV